MALFDPTHPDRDPRPVGDHHRRVHRSRRRPGRPILGAHGPEALARMTANSSPRCAIRRAWISRSRVRYVIWLGGVLRGDFGYSHRQWALRSSTRSSHDLGPASCSRASQRDRDRGRDPVWRDLGDQPVRQARLPAERVHDLSHQHPHLRPRPGGPLLFGVTLHGLPVGELYSLGKENDVMDRIAHLVLPATILGLANAAPSCATPARDARGDGQRIHHDGAVEGHRRPRRVGAARAPQCADPDHHADRHPAAATCRRP